MAPLIGEILSSFDLELSRALHSRGTAMQQEYCYACFAHSGLLMVVQLWLDYSAMFCARGTIRGEFDGQVLNLTSEWLDLQELLENRLQDWQVTFLAYRNLAQRVRFVTNSLDEGDYPPSSWVLSCHVSVTQYSDVLDLVLLRRLGRPGDEAIGLPAFSHFDFDA